MDTDPEPTPPIYCSLPTKQAHLGIIGAATSGQVCIVEQHGQGNVAPINPTVVRSLARCTGECGLVDVDPMPPYFTARD